MLKPYFAHSCCADANAGDDTLISDETLYPAPALGSGKFGTPCERMQSADATACPMPVDPVVRLDLADDPQAVIATAHVKAASVTSTLEHSTLTTASVLADDT
jgi:hypothetical protein